MKNIISIFTLLLILVACGQEKEKNYLSLSGHLENNKDSILTVLDNTGIVKEIKIDSQGNFSDTLKVEKASIYTIKTSNNKLAPIYLKNGYNRNEYEYCTVCKCRFPNGTMHST